MHMNILINRRNREKLFNGKKSGKNVSSPKPANAKSPKAGKYNTVSLYKSASLSVSESVCLFVP